MSTDEATKIKRVSEENRTCLKEERNRRRDERVGSSVEQ